MKANNGSGNNKSRDEWETPLWLFNRLNNQYSFDYDCCATNLNKKVQQFGNNFEKVRFIDLIKVAWMNPPFSKASVMFKHFFKVVRSGIAIYRCDNFETKIWQEIIFPNATWIFIPDKRIAYEGMNGNGSRFPSALIGYNVGEPRSLTGTLLKTTGGLLPSKKEENLIIVKSK